MLFPKAGASVGLVVVRRAFREATSAGVRGALTGGAWWAESAASSEADEIRSRLKEHTEVGARTFTRP